jgi:hypothetical protein
MRPSDDETLDDQGALAGAEAGDDELARPADPAPPAPEDDDEREGTGAEV